MFTKSALGFLFIGDPHVSSRRIGRRKDDYLASVIEKLAACASLCVRYKLIPVILGDLFHRNDDNSLKMLNRLIRVLKTFPVVPWVLEGNHDKEQTSLTEEDALALVELAGAVRVASQEALIAEYSFSGEAVRLWGCPYGAAIPAGLAPFAGKTVMVTHHDMAFGSTYPGALPLAEVLGCEMVVNGHMHDTKPFVKAGATWWCNPGNIEPLSIDLAAHVPCAWEWRPEFDEGVLKPHPLPHGLDLFDFTGLQVEASSATDAVSSLAPQASKFALLLGEQTALDAAKTDDASVMLQDLTEVLAASGVSAATQQLMQAVAAGVVDALVKRQAAPLPESAPLLESAEV